MIILRDNSYVRNMDHICLELHCLSSLTPDYIKIRFDITLDSPRVSKSKCVFSHPGMFNMTFPCTTTIGATDPARSISTGINRNFIHVFIGQLLDDTYCLHAILIKSLKGSVPSPLHLISTSPVISGIPTAHSATQGSRR